MRTVAGIFSTATEARQAMAELRSVGIDERNINLLVPGSPEEIERELQQIPTMDTEGHGTASALGGVVGTAAGMSTGTLAALLIPGVGMASAIGLAAMALFGAGGALAGIAAGDKLEDDSGLPHDDIFLFENALRDGKSVVFALVDDDHQKVAQNVLDHRGAMALDSARDGWWSAVRSQEEDYYSKAGGDFTADESTYRQGYQRALSHAYRGRTFGDVEEKLRACDGDACDSLAYRKGFERGHEYHNRTQSN